MEARFAEQIRERLDAMVAEYLARFGTIIDTDRARELCADYTVTIATRTRFSRSVYNPAKALADEIYRREIRRIAPLQRRRILFTSGGTGAGKSTALDWLAKTIDPEDQPNFLVDGTLSDLTAARAKIRRALTLGYDVTILHVHRDFREAVRGVVQRAVEQGRAVTLDNIAATHFRAKETLLALIEEFRDRINVRAVENADDEEARPISLAELAEKRGASVDQLHGIAHALFADEFANLKVDHPEIHEAFLQAGSRR